MFLLSISMLYYIRVPYNTDPEAYYYTMGTLNGLHEMERFEDGTKRFGNGTKCFGNKRNASRTERFAFSGTERFGLVFNFHRYSDFLAWRIGRLFIFATQNYNKFHLIRPTCVRFKKKRLQLPLFKDVINLFKQLYLHSENNDQYLGKFTVLKIVTLIDC